MTLDSCVSKCDTLFKVFQINVIFEIRVKLVLKAILLGKKGSMIKAIGTSARKELEKEFTSKVNLQLRVKVKRNWTNDVNLLSKYGYN